MSAEQVAKVLGRPLQIACSRGHDMSLTRRRLATTGSSYCGACRKAAIAAWEKRQREKKTDERRRRNH